jgi:hypothetical protein
MVNLYQYKDALGKPNEGFHKRRLCGIAINDVIGTLVIAMIFADWTVCSIFKMFIVVFCIAIILHRLFGVNTALNKKLFGIVKS